MGNLLVVMVGGEAVDHEGGLGVCVESRERKRYNCLNTNIVDF